MALLHDYFGVPSTEMFAKNPIVDWRQRAPEESGLININSSRAIEPDSLVPGTVQIIWLPESDAQEFEDAVKIKYVLDSGLKGLCVDKTRKYADSEFVSLEISDLEPWDVILRDSSGLQVPHNLEPDVSSFVYSTFATLIAERYTEDSARSDEGVKKLLEEFKASEETAILATNV